MPRTNIADEVEVLRYFEEAPIEKAEMLYNIVKEKMRGRLAGSGQRELKKKRHAPPKETGLTRPGNEGGESSQQI